MISDFLNLSDSQLAFQYLRHNMVWEEEKKVESFYLLRRGTLSSKETEEYFLWFSNGVLKLERTIPNDSEVILKLISAVLLRDLSNSSLTLTSN